MIIFSGLPLLEYLNLTDCSKLTGGILEIFKGKWVFQGNKARQIFRQHFLSPDTHTYVCVSGDKKCPLVGKFGVLCFLETPVLRFALLLYYRQNILKLMLFFYFSSVFSFLKVQYFWITRKNKVQNNVNIIK